MTDLNRVMAAITAEPGISNAGLSEELGIAPDALKELTMQLRAQGRAAFRSLPDEDGDIVVGWFPVPYVPAASKASEEIAPAASVTEVRNQPSEPSAAPSSELMHGGAIAKCPECGHIAKNAAGLSIHRSTKHGVLSSNPKAEQKRRRVAAKSQPGKEEIPAPKRSADDVRHCPVDECPGEFRGLHSRKSLINHLVRLHDIELGDAKLIADGKLSPPVMDAADPAVDADIIPPSEVECEGCDSMQDGKCSEDEECVCNCGKKMEQLQAEDPVEIEKISAEINAIPDCGDACRIGPAASPEVEAEIPDCKYADCRLAPRRRCYVIGNEVCRSYYPASIEDALEPVDNGIGPTVHVKVEVDDQEPTSLGQMCGLAREIEEIARRRGYSCGVHLTCGDGITADGLFVSIKPEAGA